MTRPPATVRHLCIRLGQVTVKNRPACPHSRAMRSKPAMRVISSARRLALFAGPLAASSANVNSCPSSFVAVVASSVSALRRFCCCLRLRLSLLMYGSALRLTNPRTMAAPSTALA